MSNQKQTVWVCALPEENGKVSLATDFWRVYGIPARAPQVITFTTKRAAEMYASEQKDDYCAHEVTLAYAEKVDEYLATFYETEYRVALN